MNVALLHQLRQAGGEFVAIESLGTPGDRVIDELDELEAFGFSIERHPYLGAAYRGPAERLCPDQIEHRLDTRRVGRRVAVWNRVASTNDLAAHAASSTSNEGLVVLAEEQTAGRGRRGRTWTAPPRSSVLMSVLLFPTGPLAEPAWLTALGAVTVADVVSDWTARNAAIKWPNDVRVDGLKVAGILVERGAGAVIGIGLNANLRKADFPADLIGTATSLRVLLGAPVDRSELARDLIRRLDERYDLSERQGPEFLNKAWRDRSEHLGHLVQVATPSGPVHGRLVDLNLKDGLRLAVAGGQTLRVCARHVLGIADGPDEPPT